MSTDEYIESFNKVAIDFIKQLAIICPNSVVTSNSDVFEELLLNKKSQTAVIDQFSLHLLDYKHQIDNNDEKFFVKNNFENETKGNETLINLMLQLKSIWMTLSATNKKRVFEYMQVLCYYSREYVLSIT